MPGGSGVAAEWGKLYLRHLSTYDHQNDSPNRLFMMGIGLSISLFLSLSVSLSLPVCLSVSGSVSLCVSVTVRLSVCRCLCLSLFPVGFALFKVFQI